MVCLDLFIDGMHFKCSFLDKSPLLLCQNDCYKGDSLADSTDLSVLMPSAPLCINSKDLQVYLGKFITFFANLFIERCRLNFDF